MTSLTAKFTRAAFGIALIVGSVVCPAFGQAPPRTVDAEARKSALLLVRMQGLRIESFDRLTQSTFAGYRLTSLFTEPQITLDSGESAVWFVASPEEVVVRLEQPAAWDRAHRFRLTAIEAPRFGDAQSIYVEPNVEHVPYPESALKQRSSSAAQGSEAEQVVIGRGYDSQWPHGATFAWHLDNDHSELGIARDRIGTPQCKPRITVLDTGIYREHVTLARNLDSANEANFVEGDGPGSADDPGTSGPLKNPGHGTATIAVLAGDHINVPALNFDDAYGGAPDAVVVPVRMADSVMHFWSDEMARGIDYATDLARNSGGAYCDVVSISMGGVASRSWADAVNTAYEAGVTVVAAAGNNFGGLPTRNTVYPARFDRVLTVAGATYEDTPYRMSSSSGMQGNYGPASVMKYAVGAYTPNIPRAVWGTRNVMDLNGGGTSYATPQVAAAAALWLARRGAGYPQDWHRVEAVRWALFESAEKKHPSLRESKKYFGNGLLRVARALDKEPSPGNLRASPAARVSFPFWRILFGLDEPTFARTSDESLMFETEALALVEHSPEFANWTLDPSDPGFPKPTAENRKRLADFVVAHPMASSALKSYVVEQLR